MYEILEKLRSHILEEKLRIEKINNKQNLQSIENEISIIEEFFTYFKTHKNIDMTSLKKIYDKLEKENIKKLEEYEGLIDTLEYYKRNLPNQDNKQYQDVLKIQQFIEELNKTVKEYQDYLNNILVEANSAIKEEEIINNLEQIVMKIEKNKYIDINEYDFLLTNLSKKDILTLEEQCTLFKEITYINAGIMNGTIQYAIKQIQEQKAVINSSPTKSYDQAKKEIKSSSEFSSEFSDDFLEKVLGTSRKDEYKKALRLIEYYGDVEEKIISIVAAFKNNYSWTKRKSIYDGLTIIEERIELGVYDLKTNLIPRINEDLRKKSYDEKIFELLKTINKFCINEENKLEQNEEITKESYEVYLTNNNMKEELEVCENVSILIENLEKLSKDSPIHYNEIYKLKEILIKSKKTFTDTIEENNKEYAVVEKTYFKELKDTFSNTKKKYLELKEKIENSPEKLIKLSEEFYSKFSEVRNIIVFPNDKHKELVSNAEYDIIKIRPNNDSYSRIIQTLSASINDDFIATDTKEIRPDQKFTKDFIVDYQINKMINKDITIIYSRFQTTLKELNGNEKPQYVIFIHAIGKTNAVVNKGLYRCFNDKNNIDYYVKLLNTDWNSLSKEEYGKKVKEVENYLRRQSIKFGHLLKSYNDKLEKEEGRSK